MDLAGMTDSERIDILYADAPWLNDDGSTKTKYETLQFGNVTSFLNDHKSMIKIMLEDCTYQQLADIIYINAGTLGNWISNNRSDEEKAIRKQKKKIRKSVSYTDNIVSKEVNIVELLEKELDMFLEDIKITERMMESIPKKKKLMENIGYLIEQYKELESGVESITALPIVNIVQDVED